MAVKSRQERQRGLVLMSITFPTYTEPALPGIPEHEIYEDEDED